MTVQSRAILVLLVVAMLVVMLAGCGHFTEEGGWPPTNKWPTRGETMYTATVSCLNYDGERTKVVYKEKKTPILCPTCGLAWFRTSCTKCKVNTIEGTSECDSQTWEPGW